MHAAQQQQRQASRVPAPEGVWPSLRLDRFEDGRGVGYPSTEYPSGGCLPRPYGPGAARPDGMSGPVQGLASGLAQGRACAQPFVLVGLEAIGRAVGAGQGAVKRWIREDGFPARRCSDGTYRADPEAVRRWFWHGPGEGAGNGGKGVERSH